ncbi:hypothetical protein EVAR_9124_1 [Eumeta japonica]|uniref:Uncharacterized protein n=1 Tax=Eumeta variegata TaxID=151549 RepID=A0A4C1TW68_EUMVA|nr:hypothetical protein EVAR_9124_1 [Eumeta japonica]
MDPHSAVVTLPRNGRERGYAINTCRYVTFDSEMVIFSEGAHGEIEICFDSGTKIRIEHRIGIGVENGIEIGSQIEIDTAIEIGIESRTESKPTADMTLACRGPGSELRLRSTPLEIPVMAETADPPPQP